MKFVLAARTSRDLAHGKHDGVSELLQHSLLFYLVFSSHRETVAHLLFPSLDLHRLATDF